MQWGCIHALEGQTQGQKDAFGSLQSYSSMQLVDEMSHEMSYESVQLGFMQASGIQAPMGQAQGQRGRGRKPSKVPLAAFLAGTPSLAPALGQKGPSVGGEAVEQVCSDQHVLFCSSTCHLDMITFDAGLLPALLTRHVLMFRLHYAQLNLACRCNDI